MKKSNPLLKKELLLEPLWKLRGSAMNKKSEVFFEDSAFAEEGGSASAPGDIMSAVLLARPEKVWQLEVRKAEDPSKIHQPAESSRWVWRMAQDEVRSKDAWVVCGGEDDVKKLVEKRKAKAAKVDKLKNQIEKLQEKQMTEAARNLQLLLEQLVAKRGLLKDLEGKLRKMKGQPVALKKFLEEVVLLNCVLLPP